MTVTYSFDVAKATFGGFTKLLLRWRGSIYKILWREFLLFCVGYASLSFLYRCCLNEHQREVFERVVVYVDTFSDLIPLSFVLGFYVSMVATRWVNQYNVIPWTDKVSFLIASYVHGSDHRSRAIRRTLGRYLILLQVMTFQTVSTAVKRRFPTTHHLVEAGLMTKEEESIYEKVDFPYGKWWLPCHWFTALATRAKKEGRIKDNLLLNALLQEVMKVRDNCAIMIGFDWISVPLVYTQVVTIATYMYTLSLLIGKQYIDPSKGYTRYPVDLYVPVFTLLQFFFYVGWLKVAEQILNPYGEDDDDYELNWVLDRTVNKVYLTVDALHMKHPKVKEDAFWDQLSIHLPQTKHSARYFQNPDLGSASGLNVNEAEYVPMEEWYEQDCEEHQYRNESVKKKDAKRQNSSFIRRMFGSRRPKPAAGRSLSCMQGVPNPSFSMADEDEDNRRRSSLKKLVRNKKKAEDDVQGNDHRPAAVVITHDEQANTSDLRIKYHPDEKRESHDEKEEDDLEANPEEDEHGLMPPIPEEASRANSLANIEWVSSHQADRVHDLVKEASEVLQELSQSVAAQERWKANEGKGYESCCGSGVHSEEEEEEEEDQDKRRQQEVFVLVESQRKEE